MLSQVEKVITCRQIIHSEVWNDHFESQNDRFAIQNSYSTVQNNKNIHDAEIYLSVWVIYVSVLKRLSSLIGSQIL